MRGSDSSTCVTESMCDVVVVSFVSSFDCATVLTIRIPSLRVACVGSCCLIRGSRPARLSHTTRFDLLDDWTQSDKLLEFARARTSHHARVHTPPRSAGGSAHGGDPDAREPDRHDDYMMMIRVPTQSRPICDSAARAPGTPRAPGVARRPRRGCRSAGGGRRLARLAPAAPRSSARGVQDSS